MKWNEVFSLFFKIESGVRQGSVLSPLLFAIYVDEISQHFPTGSEYFIVLYADDILLLSPPVSELQRLLTICEVELEWLDMQINEKKSACLRIGPRHDIRCGCLITRSEHILPWVDEIRYLGVYILSASRFKCSLQYAKRAFYRAANGIFGKIGRAASEEVMLQLLNSKCMPILLYGLDACDLKKADLCSLDFVVNRFL